MPPFRARPGGASTAPPRFADSAPQAPHRCRRKAKAMARSMTRLVGVAAAATLLGMGTAGAAEKRGKKDERRNMELVGMDDLQARSAYQPIVYRQGDRWI